MGFRGKIKTVVREQFSISSTGTEELWPFSFHLSLLELEGLSQGDFQFLEMMILRMIDLGLKESRCDQVLMEMTE